MRMLRRKRLLSLLLCLVMVLSFFPTALADGEDDGIILEDERDHDHEHEGEDQGTIAPVNEEPVGAIHESPDEEPAEKSVEADALGGPETDGDPADEKNADLVRVEFICDPEDAVITVYDPSQLDENGEPTVIEPEEDGSWLLAAGSYIYDAVCNGYCPAFNQELNVVAHEKSLKLNVTLKEDLLISEQHITSLEKAYSPNATTAREKAIIARINELYTIISNAGGYFNDECSTVCGKGSSGHSCSHCKLANVVKAKWFTNAFGTVSTDQFFLTGGGNWSCYSFAVFASWYIFRADDSDSVYRNKSENKTVKFNYENMSANANVGDYLNLDDHHGAILVSFDENGITVLDSNYGNSDGKSNCAVRIHTISYSKYTNVEIVKIHSKSKGDNQFDTNSYTFYFNSNGGNGSMAPMYISFGDAFTIRANTFTRTGYQFEGWYAKRDADSTWYVAGKGWLTDSQISSGGYSRALYGDKATKTFDESWTKGYSGKSTYTFYAQWKSAPTYTVTYDKNGGNWAPSSQTKTHGVDLTLATAHPARSSDSAGSYTVSLDPNGGTVEKTSYSVPRTNDYTFRNWNTKADGSGTSYEAGGTYSANASVTLYAQYDRTTRTSSIKLPTPSRNGAAFLGWATSPSASSGVTGSYTPPGNVTLYAIWSYETPKLWLSSSSIQLDVVTKPTQKINYYYSGDTANGYYLSSEIAYSSIPNVIQYSWGSGEECVIITGLRAGHAYLQISLVEYNTGNILYSALCEVTVTDPRSYTIRYDANGGYGAPASQTKTHNVDINLNGSEPKRDSEYGETLTLRFDANGGTVEPSEMTAQKITWYSFDSWNTARDGSGTKYYGGSSYSGNANLTLYAQWDSGTSSTSFVLPEPTRQGYRFIGWAAIPGGEPKYAAGAKVTLRDSGTIYAIWEAIRLPGDVNGDGVVNGTDLIRLRRYLAGENVEIVAENADVNGDGTINGMDLIRLRKYLAGEAVDLK